MKKFLKFSLAVCVVMGLAGCGDPCRTEPNEKASKILHTEIKNTDKNWMDSCGFVTDLEEYVLNIYGFNNLELEQIMKNVSESSKIQGVNMKILIYKTPLHFSSNSNNSGVAYSRVVKPNEKPFLTIKIKNKGE